MEDFWMNLCLLRDVSDLEDIVTDGQIKLQCESAEPEERLRCAKKFLLLFIQQNFVGCRRELNPSVSSDVDPSQALEVDSEPLNVNVRNPELLHAALEILQGLAGIASVESLVWRLRGTVIHQQVLDERTGQLYQRYQEIVQELDSQIVELDGNPQTAATLTLEIVQGFILFKRVNEATEYLKKAKVLLNSQLNLVSMLGYRTRFQTKPLPQLALKVVTALEDIPSANETHTDCELPKLLLLEDDTRLEKVQFVNKDFEKIMELPSLIQCLVVTEM